MRILIVTPIYPPEIGGPATYSLGAAKELRKRGHHVEIIALSDEAVAVDDTATHFLPKRGNKAIRQARLTALIARKARKFDIVFGLDIAVVGLATVMAAKIARKPCAIRYVGDVAWERSTRDSRTRKNLEEFLASPDANKKVLWLQRRVFRGASAVVACSNFLRDIAAKYYNPKKVFSIYNALDSNVPDKNECTRSLGLGDAFVTVCRLVPWKRVDSVIEAMKTVASKHSTARLIVIGDGPELENLKALAAMLGLADAVVFTGRKPNDETLRYVSACKGFVLNSAYEGMAFVLLEAMACRTPIICSGIPQNLEIVRDGETGFTVAPETGDQNVRQLADRMLQVLEKPGEAARVAENAHGYLEKEHSWTLHAGRLEEVFRSLTRAS